MIKIISVTTYISSPDVLNNSWAWELLDGFTVSVPPWLGRHTKCTMETVTQLRKNKDNLIQEYRSNLQDVLELQDTFIQDVLPSLTDELELCPEAVTWVTDWLCDTCTCLFLFSSSLSLLIVYLASIFRISRVSLIFYFWPAVSWTRSYSEITSRNPLYWKQSGRLWFGVWKICGLRNLRLKCPIFVAFLPVTHLVDPSWSSRRFFWTRTTNHWDVLSSRLLNNWEYTWKFFMMEQGILGGNHLFNMWHCSTSVYYLCGAS